MKIFSVKFSVRLFKSSTKSKINYRFLSELSKERESRKFNPFWKVSYDLWEPSKPKCSDRICITILGNGAVGQPRCIGLFTDSKSFLFNCGEGVGRLCREYDIDFISIRNIFITQRKWNNISGIHDIFFTHSTYGVRKFFLYGPSGIDNFVHILPIEKHGKFVSVRFLGQETYEDETLEIQCIPLRNEKYSLLKNKHWDTFTAGDDECYSYVCKIFNKPSELNLEKCVEYGVPVSGPELLKLKKGENVVLPSGKTVYSADVLEQPAPGNIFLVVDCPSEMFLDSLTNEGKFDEYILPSDASLDVSAVFHFAPPHVVTSKKYSDWISRFPQKAKHFILNSDNSNVSSEAIHHSQQVLNHLHPEIFKLLNEKEKVSESYSALPVTLIHPPPMLQYHIRPKEEFRWDNVVFFNGEQYLQTAKAIPGFDDIVNEFKSSLQNNNDATAEKSVYPEVVFFGTGSATSTAYRNVTAILVTPSPNCCILLDCGEGTYNQLVRYYGISVVDSILKNISCIFISHKHTDHYMGLFTLIKARADAFKASGETYRPLALILPMYVECALKRFFDIFGSMFRDLRIYSCRYLEQGKGREKKLKTFIGNVEIQTVPVVHCSDAHGAVIQLGSKWKIVYSGDTAPCQRLIEAGQNCSLLIHEASIEDDLLYEANIKNHSTPAQVVDIAEKMNAKHTIMTHFSKRYLAAPIFRNYEYEDIGISFDFMKVRPCDLSAVPLFLPVLKCLFREHLYTTADRSSNVVSFENVFTKVLKS